MKREDEREGALWGVPGGPSFGYVWVSFEKLKKQERE